MKFNYFKKTGEIYRNVCGEMEWDGDEGYDFDYEVEADRVEEALADLTFNDYFFDQTINNETALKIKQKLKNFISDIDLSSELSDFYGDRLKDYFEQEAQESENGD